MVERQQQVQMLEQPRVRSDTCHHGYISLEDDAHIFSSLLCFGCCCLESVVSGVFVLGRVCDLREF